MTKTEKDALEQKGKPSDGNGSGLVSDGQGLSPRKLFGGLRLAFNVFDLLRIEAAARDALLAGLIDKTSVVRVDADRPDETGTELRCGTLQAACIADVVRDHDRKAGINPCRIYANSGGAWRRLRGVDIMVVDVGGKWVLNPGLFPGSVDAVQAVPLGPAAVRKPNRKGK